MRVEKKLSKRFRFMGWQDEGIKKWGTPFGFMALLLGERTLKGRCVSVPHNQPEFELCKVEGDVIGLRLAYYLKEINVPGAQRGGIRALKVEMTV